MPRLLNPKTPTQLIGFINRLIGWVSVSDLPGPVKASLTISLSECVGTLNELIIGNASETQKES
jgi:hypothetical protein